MDETSGPWLKMVEEHLGSKLKLYTVKNTHGYGNRLAQVSVAKKAYWRTHCPLRHFLSLACSLFRFCALRLNARRNRDRENGGRGRYSRRTMRHPC
jgi:hypothetical protein